MFETFGKDTKNFQLFHTRVDLAELKATKSPFLPKCPISTFGTKSDSIVIGNLLLKNIIVVIK